LLGLSEGLAHSLEPILSISRFLLGGSGLLLFGFGLGFRFHGLIFLFLTLARSLALKLAKEPLMLLHRCLQIRNITLQVIDRS
jgi:hypothetical protein